MLIIDLAMVPYSYHSSIIPKVYVIRRVYIRLIKVHCEL